MTKTCLPFPTVVAFCITSKSRSCKSPELVSDQVLDVQLTSENGWPGASMISKTESIISWRSRVECSSFQAVSQNPEACTFLKIWRLAGKIRGWRDMAP